MASCLAPSPTIGQHCALQGSVAGGGFPLRLVARRWQDLGLPEQLARWDALAADPAEPNPFLESWYLLPALRAFDAAQAVQVLCLESGSQLAGLFPVHRSKSYYGHRLPHWRGWTHDNAFLGSPLVARGFEAAFWHALLAWIEPRDGTALFLHLPAMVQDGPMHRALMLELADHRHPHATVLREDRAFLQSALSPEDYLDQSLSGKKRKELRRQHRRLEEAGILATERADDAAGVGEWIEEFLALEHQGWKGAAGSALACDPRTATLFRQALTGAAERGRLERLAVRLDGRPLAMLATFLTPPGAFSFKTAFAEDFARYSPGVLLQRENLELLQRPGIAWADSCAAADHPMIDHFWRERRTICAVNVGLGGVVRRQVFRALAAWETRSRKEPGS